MMGLHPDVAWISQFSLRRGEIPGRIRMPLGGWINRTCRRTVGFTWQKLQKWDTPFPHPVEGSAIWAYLIGRTEGFLDAESYSDELACRVRSAIRSELRAWKLERMLVKIPHLTRAIQLIDQIFPDAVFVHIVRDGRAVALSNRARFVNGGLEPDEALRKSAANWLQTVTYVDRSADTLGDHRLMALRYEDFCADVHGWVRRALIFCDLDPKRVSLAEVPRTLTPTNDRWLGSCTESDKRILSEELEARGERPSFIEH
jgi:hypothetical protein